MVSSLRLHVRGCSRLQAKKAKINSCHYTAQRLSGLPITTGFRNFAHSLADYLETI